MNRRKFLGALLKSSAGVVTTTLVGNLIFDIATSEVPKFLRGDGTYQVIDAPMEVGKSIPLLIKGHQYIDAGYVYAPYIPVIMTTPMVDERPNKLISRHNQKPINEHFYGTLTITS